MLFERFVYLSIVIALSKVCVFHVSAFFFFFFV
jgi:hypothetical protein